MGQKVCYPLTQLFSQGGITCTIGKKIEGSILAVLPSYGQAESLNHQYDSLLR